jgi:hypothetical protein
MGMRSQAGTFGKGSGCGEVKGWRGGEMGDSSTSLLIPVTEIDRPR